MIFHLSMRWLKFYSEPQVIEYVRSYIPKLVDSLEYCTDSRLGSHILVTQ